VRFYAGVGSRETPPEMLHWMTWAARALAAQGWILRSGHADGADEAFETGANGRAEIFLPWRTYNHETPVRGKRFDFPDAIAYTIAEEVHPSWYKLGSGGRALHARNCHIVRGPQLLNSDQFSRFVLCWTEEGKRRGGTATSIRMANKLNIPVMNLWHPAIQERIEDMVSDYADTLV
jgi:hypothetical protein